MRQRLSCALAVAAALLAGEASRGNAAEAPMPAPALQTPIQVVQAIATGCRERRYSDVGSYLHPTLRRTWIEIGYSVKDFCELLTRANTLVDVQIVKEERVDAHAVVFVNYVYAGGGENSDRSVLLQEKGAWKLAG